MNEVASESVVRINSTSRALKFRRQMFILFGGLLLIGMTFSSYLVYMDIQNYETEMLKYQGKVNQLKNERKAEIKKYQESCKKNEGEVNSVLSWARRLNIYPTSSFLCEAECDLFRCKPDSLFDNLGFVFLCLGLLLGAILLYSLAYCFRAAKHATKNYLEMDLETGECQFGGYYTFGRSHKSYWVIDSITGINIYFGVYGRALKAGRLTIETQYVTAGEH
jgi:hypothetical protein